uniref:Phage minor structural protein n=1 Tax=Staphylococcus aureus TaxID=1280 RepID=A0A0M4TZF1_STAAU|nr:phage minor structural protein [Staphylococcus aureus]
MDGYTEIGCIASYLADITTAKPYAPGKFEKKTTSEALRGVLSDTGWEVSEQKARLVVVHLMKKQFTPLVTDGGPFCVQTWGRAGGMYSLRVWIFSLFLSSSG